MGLFLAGLLIYIFHTFVSCLSEGRYSHEDLSTWAQLFKASLA